ncbi:MAG TPA: hypothetical protein VFF04_05160 [Candidatus Babeliales bacterium]|nr:hypothetical protein [Candidatus Babeliales bacterium]
MDMKTTLIGAAVISMVAITPVFCAQRIARVVPQLQVISQARKNRLAFSKQLNGGDVNKLRMGRRSSMEYHARKKAHVNSILSAQQRVVIPQLDLIARLRQNRLTKIDQLQNGVKPDLSNSTPINIKDVRNRKPVVFEKPLPTGSQAFGYNFWKDRAQRMNQGSV